MTPQDKRERRQARHEAQLEAKNLLIHSSGMSGKRLNAAARTVTDRLIADVMRRAHDSQNG